MTMVRKPLRTCPKGHKFYKTTDCPTCPVCERERKPATGFLSLLSSPARRALERKGISTLQQLAEKTEDEISRLHGMGPSALSKLQRSLASLGLNFKE